MLPQYPTGLTRGALLNRSLATAHLVVLAFYVVATAAVSAERKGDISIQFEECRMLADDQTRLACLKNLLPKTKDESATSASELWKLVRTPHPQGGADAVSIMHTADTARSDPELAGLMIRCSDKADLETLLALVRPVPPRSKRDVIVTAGAAEVVLHAETASVGAALVLPIDTSMFTTGTWHDLKELSVRIQDPEGEIRGVIALSGIGPAIAKLTANCPQG